MLTKHNRPSFAPGLFQLGDSWAGTPAGQAPADDQKVSDLAMFLTILSSLVLIFRK